MGEALKERIKQATFASVYQEAYLSLMVAADELQRHTDDVCEQYGITSAQYNVLRILRGVHPDGHARCDIIDRMIQTAPDVTRLIDRLVKAGLAERGRSEQDGRLSLTFITNKGLKLLEKMQPQIESTEDELSSRISERQARSLANLCEKLIPERQ